MNKVYVLAASLITCLCGHNAVSAATVPYEDKGLTNFVEQLWDLDVNRLKPSVDYDLDLQGRVRSRNDGHDNAVDPLFAYVDPSVFQRPTYKAFVALLDNYVRATGIPEIVTPQEEKEAQHFIDVVFGTKVMQLAYKFLKDKGKANNDEVKFKHEVYNMWFTLYRRSQETRKYDSSGFEHVFIGETRNDRGVIGFHNWVQFYLQEKRGSVDYKGFMGSDKNPHLQSMRFAWKGEVKPKGALFIGTSPEFEIALYTVAYLMGHKVIQTTLGNDPVIIKCHQIAGKIGICSPETPRGR